VDFVAARGVHQRPQLPCQHSGDPAFRKHYILNLTQALGTGADAVTAATKVPAVMNVDYVRVWK